MSIRKLSITVSKFIYQYLWTEKRLPNRVKLFHVLLYPFTVINNTYKAWRNEAIIQANVTVSKKSVEWYLKYKFDSTLQRIYIETNKGGGLLLGVEVTEPDYWVIMGVEGTEPDDYAIMTIDGEHPDMGFARFAVYVPTALIAQSDAIAGIMDIYAVTDFVIVEF